MKVLHLPVTYLPWTIGGKEVYTHSLCRALTDAAVENCIAIHSDSECGVIPGDYTHEGITVHVLPPLPNNRTRTSSYEKTFDDLPGFSELLEKISPDIVHFHDQGGGASLSHMREVKSKSIPVLLTYHTPGQSCPQRELLRFGKTPCDGQVKLHRCTTCRLTVSGVPKLAAALIALAEWPGINPESELGICRALSGRVMTRMFRDSLKEFFSLADAIVVYAEWAREMLIKNNAPIEKVHFFRTGGREPWKGLTPKKFPDKPKLLVACLGRCASIKGFHILIKAVKLLPNSFPIEVDFLGPPWETEPYGRKLLSMIDGDTRFKPPRSLPNSTLSTVLSAMDVVVVPSIWLETGPLTVFDALACGVPVIGSRLGGIAELIMEGKNGWLFEPGDVEALAALLKRLVTNPSEIKKVQASIVPLRTMRDVAADYLPVYTDISRRPYI